MQSQIKRSLGEIFSRADLLVSISCSLQIRQRVVPAANAAQRKATLDDITGLAGLAGSEGTKWVSAALVVGILLIAVLLGGLLGTLLLYRRLMPRLERP